MMKGETTELVLKQYLLLTLIFNLLFTSSVSPRHSLFIWLQNAFEPPILIANVALLR